MRHRFVLVALVFLHGAFASGMVPVLSLHLEERAPIAFALYFTGMVIGQLAIVKVRALSRLRSALPIYEVALAGSILLMAGLLTPAGLIVGRLLEGIGSGLTLPLVFAHIVRLSGWASPERRVAVMNSAFALGFVSGPVVIRALAPLVGTAGSLALMAALFAAGAVAFRLLAPRELPPAPDPDAPGAAPPGLDLFFPLFAAKATYAYMLAFVSGHVHVWFPDLDIAVLMLILSGVFVVGQVAGTALVKVAPAAVVRVAVPAALSAAMAWMAITEASAALFAVALAHSLLALVGYHNFVDVPGDARTFALFNLLSDPAMILGSALAVTGTAGAWGIAVLGLVPLARAPLTRPAGPRG